MQIRFTDVDEIEIGRKIFAWRTANPEFNITKTHAVERLPLALRSPQPGKLLLAHDQVSCIVEYEAAQGG